MGLESNTKAAMSNIHLMYLPEGTDKVCLKICLDVYFYVNVSHVCGMSLKVKSITSELWAVVSHLVWVLETEPCSSKRAASILLNHLSSPL